MASLFLGLTDWIVGVVALLGYPGIFILMIVEGILTPIPSEFIMPFAGSLAALGRLSLPAVVLTGTAGAAIGNAVAYKIGAHVGRPLIARYGKLVGLGDEDLDWAERWFTRYGNLGILIGHALPGIRSFISFPAGIGRMPLRRFVLFSTIGAAIWNTILVVAGFYLVERWTAFAETTENVDLYVVAAALAALLAYVYWRKARTRRRADEVA
ncbi:MAG TPA: DedA family protein [Thermoplasmata archaeon]|nr:DedA family protein [Thermoplasmata archaeon]